MMDLHWCMLAGLLATVSAQPPISCTPSPCVNSGICEDDAAGQFVKCHCVPGFKGKFCDDPDLCVGSPCDNGGTCIPQPLSLSHTCNCLPGFTGSKCSSLVSACSSNPCINGNCQDLITDFRCQCAPGFTGKRCDAEIGLCKDDPCTGLDLWATCTEEEVGYTCGCSTERYFGLNCEGDTGTCGQQEESYCICSVNYRPVKFPMPTPTSDHQNINIRDVIALLVGLLAAWAVGTALLLLWYFCCGQGAVGGGAHRKRSKQPWNRPDSATTTTSFPSSHSSVTSPRQVQPSVTPTTNKNIYRAGFVDGMSHMVSNRKSPNTYTSGTKDW